MEISYDYYRIFYYVAKYGSISHSAKVLFLSQPNVSRTIQKLEQQLGCTLIIRSHNGIKLTTEGEKIYNHLKIAFEHITLAEKEVISEKRLENGFITIAATEVALYASLQSVIANFRMAYPNVKIKLTISNNSNVLSMVKNGLVDFAITTTNKKTEAPLKSTKITSFREILCSKHNDINSGIQAIDTNTFIGMSTHTYTYHFCKMFLVSEGITKEPDIIVDTSNQILQLVKSGLGIGFISEPLAENYIKQGIINEIRLKTSPPIRNVCLVEDGNKLPSNAAKAFLKFFNL